MSLQCLIETPEKWCQGEEFGFRKIRRIWKQNQKPVSPRHTKHLWSLERWFFVSCFLFVCLFLVTELIANLLENAYIPNYQYNLKKLWVLTDNSGQSEPPKWPWAPDIRNLTFLCIQMVAELTNENECQGQVMNEWLSRRRTWLVKGM